MPGHLYAIVEELPTPEAPDARSVGAVFVPFVPLVDRLPLAWGDGGRRGRALPPRTVSG